MANRYGLLVVLGLGIIAFALSVFARLTPRFPGDLQLTLLVQSIDSQALLLVTELLSFLFGGWPALVLVFVVCSIVWWRLGRAEGSMVLGAGLVSPVVDSLLKGVVNRPRPTVNLVRVVTVERGSGFPSGHALLAAVLIGLMIYFIATHSRKGILRALSVACLLLLIFLVGLSRVYLGAHWPSDVIGGYLVGGTFLAALIWYFETRKRARRM